jgi:hypothetical protein
LPALELEGAGEYGTLYISNNGMPHKVRVGSGNVVTDEQGQSFAIDGPSQAVIGGGYVHVLSGVSGNRLHTISPQPVVEIGRFCISTCCQG